MQTVESTASYFLGGIADSTASMVLKQKLRKLEQIFKTFFPQHSKMLPVCHLPQLIVTIKYFCAIFFNLNFSSYAHRLI